MAELIQAIALLCNINISTGDIKASTSENDQLSCQKYYIKCVKDSGSIFRANELPKCILDKPFKT